MWGKTHISYYLPILFGCVCYIGKSLFTNNKQLGPIIEIGLGKIRGVLAYSREGRAYYQYLGIPFGQAERFESPQPPDNWTDVFTADTFGPMCIGLEFLTSGRLMGQEDCLYLNIFSSVSPKRVIDEVKPKLLPVMVFIHGGGFNTGSASGYGEEYFLDHSIILVTINYRLGIFGFLNAEHEDARGNQGLKDQAFALQWVQKHIQHFGGDPNKVTIFGESAGGASVHFHLLSPMSKGLFAKAISMSGNSLNPFWQTNRSYTEQVEMLAKRFSCPVEDRRQFLNCLKKIPANDLGKIHEAVQSPIHPNRDAFSPSIEKFNDNDTFLAEQPYQLLRTGKYNKVPWMTGVNEGEGLVFVARVMYNESLATTICSEEAWNRYMPLILFHERNDEAFQKLRRIYFEDTDDLCIYNKTDEFEELFSARLFFQSHHITASLHRQHAPLYVYYYTYRKALNFFNILKNTSPYSILPIEIHAGFALFKDWVVKTVYRLFNSVSHLQLLPPCHADELPLLFRINPLLDISQSIPEDYEMSRSLIQTLVDFAWDEHSLKFRNTLWPSVQKNESLKYMRLDSHGGFLEDPFSKQLQTLEELNIL